MRFVAIPSYGEQYLVDDAVQEATLILGRYPLITREESYRGIPYDLAIDTIELARRNGRISIEQEA